MLSTLWRGIQFFLLIIVPLLLVTDFSGIENHVSSMKDMSESTLPAAGSMQEKLLLKQYQNTVQEIKARLEHEHLLFVLKFTLAGGILVTLFRLWNKNKDITTSGEDTFAIHSLLSPVAAILCWSAVAVMAIIDIRSHFNSQMIKTLGDWVLSFEKSIGLGKGHGFQGWEHFLRSTSLVCPRDDLWEYLVAHPIMRLDRQLFTWILYAAATYSFIFIPTVKSKASEDKTIQGIRKSRNSLLSIGQRAIPFCILLFGFLGFYYYADKSVSSMGAKIYFIIVIAVIILMIKTIGSMKK
jgi:hypothetical protein